VSPVGKGFQILELNVLRGIDRNKATGDDPDGSFLPTEAYNLAPERRGALVPFGRVTDLMVNAAPVDLAGTPLGYDERGLVSLDAGLGRYRLFNGYASAESVMAYNPATAADTPHAHGFGAYRHIAQFFGYDAPAEATTVEPFTRLRPVFTSEAGSEATETNYGATPFIAVAYNPDEPTEWMAVKANGVAFFTNNIEGGFTAVTNIGISGIRTLACGAGVWVAAGANGTRYSTNNGATWSVPATANIATGNIFKVTWSGTLFTASRWIATDTSALWSSGDGSAWVVSSNLATIGQGGSVPIEEVIGAFAFSEAGLGVAVTATNKGASANMRKVFLSENGGQTWTWNAMSPYSFGFNTGKVRSEPALQLAGGPQNSFWLVNNVGQILYLPDMLASPSVSTIAYTPTTPARFARAVEFDRTRRKWYAVMADGSFWESDSGTSIIEVPEMKLDAPPTVAGADGRNLSPDLVRASEDSVVVVGSDGGDGAIRFVGATFGLSAGTYTVYWVSTVSTEGGQLVVDIGSRVFAFDTAFGSVITVSLDSIADIIANEMPWIDPLVPAQLAHAEDLLMNRTFVDIYVSYSEVTPGDVEEAGEDSALAEVVPIFAFALTPDDPPPSRVIPKEPVGRILGSGDGVMAAAFQAGPEAVVHNGRVWAVLSQDESLYRTADARTVPEAASLRAGVRIGYSDVGYINLMRQLSYVQLIPAQSDEFVGMVSTPSGLLAFFENEVYLIAGDPALGNLQIELYPDIVGADPGTRITKMGGVVFCIWKGDVYVLAGGQAQAISRPAYLFEDQFVDVVAEPCQKCLVAKTATGKTFRYFIEFQQWFENTITTYDFALPSPSDCENNSRYVTTADRIEVVRRDGAPATPYITYKGIDYGDKNRVDAAYGMLVPVSGDFAGGRPILRFKILEGDDEVDDALSTSSVLAYREGDTWRFYLPRGLKARLHDFRLILDGMEMGDTLEPQLQIEWVPGHRALRNASVP
jgi:hypothetical protein